LKAIMSAQGGGPIDLGAVLEIGVHAMEPLPS
jgi:hypothetical protein